MNDYMMLKLPNHEEKKIYNMG